MINEDYLRKLKENEKAAKKTNDNLNKGNKKTNENLKTTETSLGKIGRVLKTIAIAEVFRRGAVEVAKANKLFAEQEKILTGLAKTAEAYGENQELAIQAAKELESDILGISDAAEGLKFLLGAGFNVEEALQIGQAFKDIGAFNNVVGDFGQAFVDASKGIKTGSIELIENIGLTERLSNVLKRNNVSIKDGIDLANNEAQRRAVLNSIIEQGNKFRGNEKELLETAEGQYAATEKAIEDLYKTVGERANPVFETFNETLKTTVQRITDVVKVTDGKKQRELTKDVKLLIFQYRQLNEQQKLTTEESDKLEKTANKLISIFPELNEQLKVLSDESAITEEQNKALEKILEVQNKREEVATIQDEINKLAKENLEVYELLEKQERNRLELQLEVNKAEEKGSKIKLFFARDALTQLDKEIDRNRELIKENEKAAEQERKKIFRLQNEKKIYEDLNTARFSEEGQEEYQNKVEQAEESAKRLLDIQKEINKDEYKDPYANRFTEEGQQAYKEALETAKEEAETALKLLEVNKRIEENRKLQRFVDPEGGRFTETGLEQGIIDKEASTKKALEDLDIIFKRDSENREKEFNKQLKNKYEEDYNNYYESLEKKKKASDYWENLRKNVVKESVDSSIQTLGELVLASQKYNKEELHDWSKTQAKKEVAQSLIDLAYAGTYAAFQRYDQAALFLASSAQHAVAASILGITAGVTGGGVTGSTNDTTEEKTEEETVISKDNQKLIEEFGITGQAETIELKLDPKGAALAVYPQLNKLVDEGYTIRATKLK